MPALIIGVGPKNGGDGPPPLTSPEGGKSSSLQPKAPDHSGEFCSGCEFYEPDQHVCMRYPEWHAHEPTDWCGEFMPGQPRSLASDTPAEGATGDSQQPPQGSQPQAPPPGR